MLIAVPLGIALLRIVPWLVTRAPLSQEVLLALAIASGCGVALGRECTRVRRRGRTIPGPRGDRDVR